MLQMVFKTLRDLQRLYPAIVRKSDVLDLKGKNIDKVLPFTCSWNSKIITESYTF